MKTYGICIGKWVSEGNFLFCTARNKTEARSEGMKYKRAWQIREPILKIVEIPESIANNDAERRNYAVTA